MSDLFRVDDRYRHENGQRLDKYVAEYSPRKAASSHHHEKLRLFLEFGASGEREGPDPYYGGAAGFERVLDLVEEASRGLLETLSRTRD